MTRQSRRFVIASDLAFSREHSVAGGNPVFEVESLVRSINNNWDYYVKQPAVYILASGRNGTLYTGVTSQLVQRIWQHKNNLAPGFTQKHHVHDLVYFELCDDMFTAITREKQIKAGSRDKKISLIESVNPEWRDLYREVI